MKCTSIIFNYTYSHSHLPLHNITFRVAISTYVLSHIQIFLAKYLTLMLNEDFTLILGVLSLHRYWVWTLVGWALQSCPIKCTACFVGTGKSCVLKTKLTRWMCLCNVVLWSLLAVELCRLSFWSRGHWSNNSACLAPHECKMTLWKAVLCVVFSPVYWNFLFKTNNSALLFMLIHVCIYTHIHMLHMYWPS